MFIHTLSSIPAAPLVNTCEITRHFQDDALNADIFQDDCLSFGSIENLEAELKAAKASGKRVKDFLESDKTSTFIKLQEPVKNFLFLKELKALQKLNDGSKYAHILGTVSGLEISKMKHGEIINRVDSKTGEYLTFVLKRKAGKEKLVLRSAMSPKDDRFSLQNIMAKIVSSKRVSKCCRVVQSKSHLLNVFKSCEHGSISVSNLQTCGSVWDCPVCAARITELRRREVQKAFDAHKESGGFISLVTRTVPHTSLDSLLSMVKRFCFADNFLKKHRAYRKICTAYCIEGTIKTFEITVTYTNGWHLHVHEIIFHSKESLQGDALSTNDAYKSFLKSFESAYYDIWADSAVKAGFSLPSKAHGLQVQNGDFAAEYIAKWGVERTSTWGVDAEMTKQHIKDSMNGYTPFELIRLYRDTGDKRLEPLLREYSDTMKGQRQLIWSKGLKDKFAIKAATDAELSRKLQDDAEHLGVVSPVQWECIVKSGNRENFFTLAAIGWDVLTNFLYSLDDYPRNSFVGEMIKKS
jgi:hypothetical protein